MHLSCFQLFQTPFNCPWRYQQATQFDLISPGTIGVLPSNTEDSDSCLLRQGLVVRKKMKNLGFEKRQWVPAQKPSDNFCPTSFPFVFRGSFPPFCSSLIHYILTAVFPPSTLPSSLLHILSTRDPLLLLPHPPPKDIPGISTQHGRHNKLQ